MTFGTPSQIDSSLCCAVPPAFQDIQSRNQIHHPLSSPHKSPSNPKTTFFNSITSCALKLFCPPPPSPSPSPPSPFSIFNPLDPSLLTKLSLKHNPVIPIPFNSLSTASHISLCAFQTFLSKTPNSLLRISFSSS